MYENLRLVRNNKNISAAQMIDALGLKTEAAYYKKESGKVKFSLEEARKISKLFNMQIEDIFFSNEVSQMDTIDTDKANKPPTDENT